MTAIDILPFQLKIPDQIQYPLLISAPHVGVLLPDDVRYKLHPEIANTLPDTDWLVHGLYDFSFAMGIPMIHAVYSRYVVDLNRPHSGPQLYGDARVQTDVLPLQSFHGQALYRPGQQPSAEEREFRLRHYYHPYHEALKAQLKALKQRFGQVIPFDAHSIKRFVPTLSAEPFADMIVGDREGQSAEPKISQALLKTLQQSPFKIAYNQPFKGGQITRGFGLPSEGVHAVQLEMSQDIYLQDGLTKLDPKKLAKLQPVLQQALQALAQAGAELCG